MDARVALLEVSYVAAVLHITRMTGVLEVTHPEQQFSVHVVQQQGAAGTEVFQQVRGKSWMKSTCKMRFSEGSRC